MDYVNALVRLDHIEQIEEAKERENLVKTDDDAVRYLFDRARKADLLEKEVEHLNEKIAHIEEEHEKELLHSSWVNIDYSNKVVKEREELREKVQELQSEKKEHWRRTRV